MQKRPLQPLHLRTALNPLGAVESELAPMGRGERGFSSCPSRLWGSRWAFYLENLCWSGPGLGPPIGGFKVFGAGSTLLPSSSAERLCTQHGPQGVGRVTSDKPPLSEPQSPHLQNWVEVSSGFVCQAQSAGRL